MHHNRELPHRPCARSCPRQLRLDLEYMQGVAAWRSVGAQYVGISYESDRPGFQCEVPDGGMDVQDEEAYLHFAHGVECYALHEIHAM